VLDLAECRAYQWCNKQEQAMQIKHETIEARGRRLAAENALNLSKAYLVKFEADRLHKRLEQSNGRFDTLQSYALLDLCNAVIGLIDDGDCMAQRDSLMDELSCDERGNPVDENGSVIGATSSFGMNHPDSPSFGGRS
jgi:hypothetical protein